MENLRKEQKPSARRRTLSPQKPLGDAQFPLHYSKNETIHAGILRTALKPINISYITDRLFLQLSVRETSGALRALQQLRDDARANRFVPLGVVPTFLLSNGFVNRVESLRRITALCENFSNLITC